MIIGNLNKVENDKIFTYKHTTTETVYLSNSSSSIMRIFKQNIHTILSLFYEHNRYNETNENIQNNMEFKGANDIFQFYKYGRNHVY